MERMTFLEEAEAELSRARECLQECEHLGEDTSQATRWVMEAEEELEDAWEAVRV